MACDGIDGEAVAASGVGDEGGETRVGTTGGEGGDLRVAVLGTGIMGSAMARRLVAAGLRTTVWDRSASATAALAEAGAVAAGSPAEAVRGAGVVIMMLPTAKIVNSVIFNGAVAEGFAPGAVCAQMGTIGIAGTAEIAGRLGQARPDVMFVDAPVSGSKGPAETGQLLILASGPDAAQAVVRPAFSAIGRRTVWLGEAGQGSRMKLAVNAYMATLIEGVAEALELAARFGLDAAKLGEAIEGGPLDAPIADAKLHKMQRGDYAPEFPLEWALKDVDLAIDGAGGESLPLLAALSRQWHAAVDAGHGRQDVSAARLALGGTTAGARPADGRGPA
jgi:3-hydroxyisobutyrate dehydrogenase